MEAVNNYREEDYKEFIDMLMMNCEEELRRNNIVEAFKKLYNTCRKPGYQYLWVNGNPTDEYFLFYFLKDYLHYDLAKKDLDVWIETYRMYFNQPEYEPYFIVTWDDFNNITLTSELLNKYKDNELEIEYHSSSNNLTITFEEGVTDISNVFLYLYGCNKNVIINLPSTLESFSFNNLLDHTRCDYIFNIKVNNKDGLPDFISERELIEMEGKGYRIQISLV